MPASLVTDILNRLLDAQAAWEKRRRQIRQIVVSSTSLRIELEAGVLDAASSLARLGIGEGLVMEEGVAQVTVPIVVRTWRGAKNFFDASGRPTEKCFLNMPLAQAIARAQAWRREWTAPEGPTLTALAKRDGVDLSYALRIMRLAYLAPDLVRGVLAGSKYSFLNVDLLTRCDLPLDWDAQRLLLKSAT